jgi:hypothetical protein
MALPSTYARVSFHYTSARAPHPCVNVTWWEPDHVIAPGDGQSEIDALVIALDALVGGQMKSGWLPDDDRSRWVGTAGVISIGGVTYSEETVATAGTGSVNSEALPDYAAAIIQKRTANPGKSGRGRVFIGCVPETLQEAGSLTTGGATELENIALKMFAPIASGGGNWGPRHHSALADNLAVMTSHESLRDLGRCSRRRIRQLSA